MLKDVRRAVIGYLPKAVACVIVALMDKGISVHVDTLSIAGGFGKQESYGRGFL